MKTLKTIFLTLAVIFSFIACEKPTSEYGTYYGALVFENFENDENFAQPCDILVEINKNNTMNFTIKSVKFAEKIPVIDIDMKIVGIITEKTKSGFTLSSPKEEIIPTDMMGTPLPQYTIKELEGTITAKELHFSMFCGEYSVYFAPPTIVY